MLYTATGQLTPTPPFDFERSLDFLGFFAPTEGEQSLAGRALAKAVLLGGQIVVFRVAAAGSVEAPALDYTLWSDQPLDEPARAAAEDRIGFFLSLHDDLRPFYAIARDDPDFAPVAQRLYGYHQVKFLTPFENACWAVLTQRNPIPIARRLKQALVERYGACLEVDGEGYWAFPEPAALAQAGPEQLRALVENERRAEYLHAIARAFQQVDEAWLRAAPYDEVSTWLRGIHGVGAWSATFVLLRGLGRMERLPVGEAQLGQSAARVYGRRISEQEIATIAERYGRWRGYWAHYLRVAG